MEFRTMTCPCTARPTLAKPVPVGYRKTQVVPYSNVRRPPRYADVLRAATSKPTYQSLIRAAKKSEQKPTYESVLRASRKNLPTGPSAPPKAYTAALARQRGEPEPSRVILAKHVRVTRPTVTAAMLKGNPDFAITPPLPTPTPRWEDLPWDGVL